MPTRRTGRRRKVLIGVLALLVVVLAGCQVFVSRMMDEMFGREDDAGGYHLGYRYEDMADELDREPISFASGDNTLRGYVYAPSNTRGLVVFCPGAGAGHASYMNEIRQMCDRGFVVLSFDNTGSGESDGDATRGLEQAVLDLDACLDYVAGDARLSGMPLVLIGHSQGAYAACAVLADGHPEVDAVISISGFDVAMDPIVGQGRWMMGDVVLLMQPFLWVDDRVEFGDAAGYSAVRGLNASGDVPALVVAGTEDEAIDFDTASLNSHADEIDDANVTYVAIATEGCNGHNTIMYSPAANAERDRVNAEFDQVAEGYDSPQDVPDSEKERLIEEADRELCNEPNPELYAAIDDFLAETGL